MGQNRENEQLEAIETFNDQGIVITRVLGVVKSGKEATVYCCEADTPAGAATVAAKVYRSRNARRFADASMYNEGRMRQPHRREARAIQTKSRFGQQEAFSKWVAEEYETLTLLYAAGVHVPRPLGRSESVIVMEYLGDDEAPARPLSNVTLEQDEARGIFDLLIGDIAAMLACDRVHGDLSAFNVLYHEGSVRLIDFPQAVDARFNHHALTLLERDVDRVCGYFARYGIGGDAWRIAHDLWGRYLRSEL